MIVRKNQNNYISSIFFLLSLLFVLSLVYKIKLLQDPHLLKWLTKRSFCHKRTIYKLISQNKLLQTSTEKTSKWMKKYTGELISFKGFLSTTFSEALTTHVKYWVQSFLWSNLSTRMHVVTLNSTLPRCNFAAKTT